ncbi:MAG: PEGA domain-containing protein [Bacteroidetes bacterium]|nr:PEGA domain-containing protein [Bacteroidota bacterium]
MKGDYLIVMRMHRKTLILVLLLLVSAPAVFADEFEIRNFKKDPSDYSAIRSSRKDVNGQACAILKVRTDLSGLSFECNQGLTGDPEYKTGEIWLYLSPREKRIKFMKEGFITEDFLFPIPIEKATVYTIVLTNKYKTGQEVPLSMGFVLIKSDPPGAEVTLNGEPTGMKTPFSKPLSLGNHQFGLNKEFYLPHQDDFEITAGNTTTIEIPLTANFGSLTVTSQPESEAEIWIDRKSTGETTPASFEMLSTGSHTLTLKKEMFETLAREFSITTDQETKLTLSMTPTFGSFSISTTPPAEIWIDQVNVGTGTYSSRLLKGLHIVEARLDKYDTITEPITIDINTPITLQWQMEPKTGILAINTNPPEANVYLDGLLKGTSPLFIENIIIGDHTLRFSMKGFGEVTKQILLQENQTLEINEKLPTGVEVTINSIPSGAIIWIDSTGKGLTPVIETLSFGEHSLKFTKQDYKELNQTINIDGTKNEFNFLLSSIIPEDRKFTDVRDGEKYEYVIIGNQTWMAENLFYYTPNSFCYDNKISNCRIYGRLYSQEDAMKACPKGWHLPSDEEWTILIEFLGGKDISGGKLKEAEPSQWKPPNTGATNSSGFSALPGGERSNKGTFLDIGFGAYFCSSIKQGSFDIWYRYLNYGNDDVRRYKSQDKRLFSVRCILDN